MSEITNILRREIPDLKITENISFKDLTSLGVGSAPLPVLAEPEDEKQLASLLKVLNTKEIPAFIFGAGTNLVGWDKPV